MKKSRIDNQRASSIAAVIINWNTSDHLLRCVEAFLAEGLAPTSVLVVDQGSTDGSIDVLRKKFPLVRTLLNRENIGYAHAVNAGMELITEEFVAVCNADTAVGKGAIKTMVEAMEPDRLIGMAGPRILDSRGRHATRFSRTSVTRGILLQLTPFFLRGTWRDAEHLTRQEVSPFVVTYVEGAFMMVRRETYLTLGGMDEGFSFFFEDADLPLRMIKSGFRVLHVPEATVTHEGGASFSQAPVRYAKEFHRNMVRLYLRHALRRAVWLGRTLVSLSALKNGILFALGRIFGRTREIDERIDRNRLVRSSIVLHHHQFAVPAGKSPLVSVIIPTRRRPELVRKLVKEMQNQTYKSIEVIVIEQGEGGYPDGNTGATWIVQQKENRSVAKNRGMREAKGEIILFCDDDIVPERSMVETHVEAHRDASVGGVSCRVTEDGLPSITTTDICRVTSYGRMVDGFQSDVTCRVETLVGANMSVKRHVAREAGYFDALYKGTSIFEEQDFSERIRFLGYGILFTNKSSVRHIPQPDGNVGQRTSDPSSYYHDFHHNELIFFLKNRHRFLLLFVIPFCFLRTIRQSLRSRLSLRQGMHMFAGVFSGIRSYYASLK